MEEYTESTSGGPPPLVRHESVGDDSLPVDMDFDPSTIPPPPVNAKRTSSTFTPPPSRKIHQNEDLRSLSHEELFKRCQAVIKEFSEYQRRTEQIIKNLEESNKQHDESRKEREQQMTMINELKDQVKKLTNNTTDSRTPPSNNYAAQANRPPSFSVDTNNANNNKQNSTHEEQQTIENNKPFISNYQKIRSKYDEDTLSYIAKIKKENEGKRILFKLQNANEVDTPPLTAVYIKGIEPQRISDLRKKLFR
eukprot:Awhi_evm1s12714